MRGEPRPKGVVLNAPLGHAIMGEVVPRWSQLLIGILLIFKDPFLLLSNWQSVKILCFMFVKNSGQLAVFWYLIKLLSISIQECINICLLDFDEFNVSAVCFAD